MAKKSSFFEKLTGASWSAEEAARENPPRARKSTRTKKSKSVRARSSAEKATTIRPSRQSAPEKPAAETEDWLGESEGQLTIDVYQTPNEIVIRSTIAGVKPDDIDITMTNDMITIKGNRQKDEQVKEEDYYYQECYWGPFSRSIILPVDVEADQAQASMKNGILTIRLPKVEKVRTKRIEIKSE